MRKKPGPKPANILTDIKRRPLTASQYCKASGLASMAKLSRESGYSIAMLRRLYGHERRYFNDLVHKALAEPAT